MNTLHYHGGDRLWAMLTDKFNLVEWLCNTDYQPAGDRPIAEIDELLEMGKYLSFLFQ